MTPDHAEKENQGDELGYLCVDDFIKSIVDARSLGTAFELRLIDHLMKHSEVALDFFKGHLGGDGRGLRLLFDLLRVNNVIEEYDGRIRLTPAFRNALRYRDLLETKIEFANFAAHDFIDFFTLLTADPGRFMQQAAMFKLFSYGRCLEFTKENHERTKRWMQYTTTLTRYEAHVCMSRHDFGRYKNMLDIGGNSGEFALQVCRKNPRIRATVFDLPLVCDIGQEHVRHEPEADRISFLKGDALADPLPAGYDIVTFKSVLHDWPDREAKQFIRRAAGALNPGGTLLIFERGPVKVGERQLPYSILPFLLFSHSFRSPDLYKELLNAMNFTDVSGIWVNLEMPFFILSAACPADGV